MRLRAKNDLFNSDLVSVLSFHLAFVSVSYKSGPSGGVVEKHTRFGGRPCRAWHCSRAARRARRMAAQKALKRRFKGFGPSFSTGRGALGKLRKAAERCISEARASSRRQSPDPPSRPRPRKDEHMKTWRWRVGIRTGFTITAYPIIRIIVTIMITIRIITIIIIITIIMIIIVMI